MLQALGDLFRLMVLLETVDLSVEMDNRRAPGLEIERAGARLRTAWGLAALVTEG